MDGEKWIDGGEMSVRVRRFAGSLNVAFFRGRYQYLMSVAVPDDVVAGLVAAMLELVPTARGPEPVAKPSNNSERFDRLRKSINRT